jgi:hypothetical protein
LSFSYLLATEFPTPQPQIDYPRLLVQDTNQFVIDASGNVTTQRAYIFEDQEILGMTRVVGNVYQSSMTYNYPLTIQVPASPISYIRVAAYLLNSLAANTARLSGILQILDVKLSMKDATAALQKQAQAWLDLDDDTGAFVIIEQVQQGDDAGFANRFWAEVQRNSFCGVLG